MKLYDFLDSYYISGNVKLNKEYCIAKHAETLASQELIEAQRKIIKWGMYFKLIFHYFLVKIGFAESLKPAKEIQESYKAEAMAEQKKIALDRQAAIEAETAKQRAAIQLVPDQPTPAG